MSSLGQKAAWRARNREKVREYNARYLIAAWAQRNASRRRMVLSDWKAANKGRITEYSARRRAVLRRACPAWADQEAISRIYAESAARGMHVDHIVPLRSKLVCGLHVEHNLQLLPGSENASKGNRVWPDMP